MSTHKKELACFWTHRVLDSLCYSCACVLHTVFSYMVSPVSAMNYTNFCCRKGIFLPSFAPRLTPSEVLGGLQQWSVRKLLWTKAAFSGTPPPIYHKAARGRCQHNEQGSDALFRNIFGRNSHTDKQSTFFSSFFHLPPLPVNKLQMFFAIPQTPTAPPLLDNQPENNPSKYLHSSSKQLPADFF